MIYVLICLSRVSTHPSDMLLGKIGLIFKMKSINSNSVKRNVKNYYMCITNKKKLNKSIRILQDLVLTAMLIQKSEVTLPPSLSKVNIVFIGQNADKFVSIVGLADF